MTHFMTRLERSSSVKYTINTPGSSALRKNIEKEGVLPLAHETKLGYNIQTAYDKSSSIEHSPLGTRDRASKVARVGQRSNTKYGAHGATLEY